MRVDERRMGNDMPRKIMVGKYCERSAFIQFEEVRIKMYEIKFMSRVSKFFLPPLWSTGQSSWLQTLRSWVRLPCAARVSE
jgi:hypothetical protein